MTRSGRSTILLNIFLMAGLSLVNCLTAMAQQQDSSDETHRKAHSRHLKGDYGGTSVNIPDLLKAGIDHDVVITKYHSPGLSGQPLHPPAYPPYELIANSCQADAVVVGVIGQQTSDITEDGHFLYTDAQFTIQHVLKNNPAVALNAGDVIVVTRAGGTIRYQSHTIRALDPSFPAYVTGKRYLLYLRSTPDTRAYSGWAEGAYLLENNRVLPLADSSSVKVKDESHLVNAANVAVSLAQHCGGARWYRGDEVQSFGAPSS